MITLTPDELYAIEVVIYNEAVRYRERNPELRQWLYLPEKPVYGVSHRVLGFRVSDFEKARTHKQGHGWSANHDH